MTFQIHVYYLEHMQQGWVIEAEDFAQCVRLLASALAKRDQRPPEDQMMQIEIVRVP